MTYQDKECMKCEVCAMKGLTEELKKSEERLEEAKEELSKAQQEMYEASAAVNSLTFFG